MKNRTCAFACVGLCIASLTTSAAVAGTISITKKETIEGPGLGIAGLANVFSLASEGTTTKTDPDPIAPVGFIASFQHNSLDYSTKATVGAHSATASTLVGILTSGPRTIPVTLSASATTPNTPSPTGTAQGTSRVQIMGGRATITELTVNGLKIINDPTAFRIDILSAAREGASVQDPVHLTAEDMVTGETIDTDVYNNSYTGLIGGTINYNSLAQLELGIPDLRSSDAIAEVDSLLSFHGQRALQDRPNSKVAY